MIDELVVMQRYVSLRRESLEHEAHVPIFNKAQQRKATGFDSIQRRMKGKDKFMIEEMMSCCLTKETAPRLAPDEERNCRVEGRRTKYSENCKVHSLRNGHVEALAKLSTL